MYAIVVESKSKFGYGKQYNYLCEVSELGEFYSVYKNDAILLTKEDAEKYLSKIKNSNIINLNEK